MRFRGVECGSCFFAAPHANADDFRSCQRYPPREAYEGDLPRPLVHKSEYCGEWRSEEFETIETWLRQPDDTDELRRRGAQLISTDPAAAIECWREASARGDAQAMYLLGGHLVGTRDPALHQEGEDHLATAAALGVADAQQALDAHRNFQALRGGLVEQARQGDVDAMKQLAAFMMLHDRDEAEYWKQEAMERGAHFEW